MSTYILSEEQIIECIPHGRSMSLLHGVIDLNEKEIVCDALSHQDLANPLRFNNELSALTVAEYVGQAIALHRYHLQEGVMKDKAKHPKEGYLAALKNVQLYIETLTEIKSPLQIKTSCIFSDGGKALYEFEVTADKIMLACGEMIVAEGNENE